MALIKINWQPTPKDLRVFGLTALVLFSLVGGLARWRLHLFGMTLGPAQGDLALRIGAGLGLLCGALAFVAPRALRPLYLFLSIVTAPIGFVVSFVVLATFYFFILTPVAWVVRVFSADAMRRRWDPKAESYWEPRPPSPGRTSYLRQY